MCVWGRYAIYFITKQYTDVWMELRLHKHFLILAFCNFWVLNLATLISFHSDHLCSVCLHVYLRLPQGSWTCKAPSLNCQRILNHMHKSALHESNLFVHVIQNPSHMSSLTAQWKLPVGKPLGPDAETPPCVYTGLTMLHSHYVCILCIYLTSMYIYAYI